MFAGFRLCFLLRKSQKCLQNCMRYVFAIIHHVQESGHIDFSGTLLLVCGRFTYRYVFFAMMF